MAPITIPFGFIGGEGLVDFFFRIGMYPPFHLSTAGRADSCDDCETKVGSATGSVGSTTKGVVAPGLGPILATAARSTEAARM